MVAASPSFGGTVATRAAYRFGPASSRIAVNLYVVDEGSRATRACSRAAAPSRQVGAWE